MGNQQHDNAIKAPGIGQARDDERGGKGQHLRRGEEQGDERNRPEQGQRAPRQSDESNRDRGQEMQDGSEE